LLNREFGANYAFWHKLGFWQKIAMTSPETLYAKNSANELIFPLVTHMAYFDTRFGHYGFLNSGYGADHILDIQVHGQVFGPQETQNFLGFDHSFCR
jgi:hypothetical protein